MKLCVTLGLSIWTINTEAIRLVVVHSNWHFFKKLVFFYTSNSLGHQQKVHCLSVSCKISVLGSDKGEMIITMHEDVSLC